MDSTSTEFQFDVLSFPPDVLGDIFALSIRSADDWDFDRGDETQWTIYLKSRLPIVVGSVCQAWRKVALEYHSLWCNWRVKLHDPTPHVVRCFERFITMARSRSSNAMMSFYLEINIPGNSLWAADPHRFEEKTKELLDIRRRVWKVIDDLCACQCRWERADITVWDSGRDYNGAMFKLYPHRLTWLREFKLCIPCHIQVLPSSDSPPSFPNLKVLRVYSPTPLKNLGLRVNKKKK